MNNYHAYQELDSLIVNGNRSSNFFSSSALPLSYLKEAELTGEDLKLLAAASWYIEDAFGGISRLHPMQTPFAIAMYRIYSRLQFARGIAIASLVSLTFFEVPSWCENSYPHPCGDPTDPNRPPLFGLPIVSRVISHQIEIGLILFLFFNILLNRCFLGPKFLVHRERVISLVLLALALIEALFSVSYYSWSNKTGNIVRIGPYLRLSILIASHGQIRRTFQKIFLLLPEILNIASLLVVFLLFFSWMGTLVFRDSNEGTTVMPNIFEASWNLFVALTTANFPDVMMPIYSQYRWSCLFFIVFLSFGLFFLMNVILSIFFNNYKRMISIDQELKRKNRCEKLTVAFKLLEEMSENHRQGWITKSTCFSLFRELNRYKSIGCSEKNRMKNIFKVLDDNGNDRIFLEEFCTICKVINETLADAPDKSDIEILCPKFYQSFVFQSFSGMVKHKFFDISIDILLVLNGALIVLESASELNGSDEANELPIFQAIESLLLLIYTVEMLSKILVFGRKAYLSKLKNCYDGFITILCIVVDVYAYIPNGFSEHIFVQYLLAARLLRLFRLFMHVERYRVICSTWVSLIPSAGTLVMTMLCSMYAFAIIGMQLFGGLISPSNLDLQDSAFANSDYYANNFNDMCSGMVTMFELLVVNNWYVIAGGFVAVTSVYARWFFIVFYVVNVVIQFNLMTAYILDTFIAEWDRQREERQSVSKSTVKTESFPMRDDNDLAFVDDEVPSSSYILRNKNKVKFKFNHDI